MMLHLTTILDSNYLSRFLAMYESLKQHHDNFELYVVCLDDKVYNYFCQKKLDSIQLISLTEIEEAYEELTVVKKTRNTIDYIFTLSPFYPAYILKKWPHLPFICSLDCDQYFFGNAECLFNQLDKHSVLIMPHRFTKELAPLEVYGTYNVSFQVFKNDDVGNRCLALWRQQCLNWCSDKLEDGCFADQKYLDSWQQHFGEAVKAIINTGAGLAPWNLSGKKISKRQQQVYVNDEKLILYHYQGLRIVYKNLINSGLAKYNAKAPAGFTSYILKPVINTILKFQFITPVDGIQRNAAKKQKNLIKNIGAFGMFYRQGKRLINLDNFYRLKIRKGKAHGFINRLANLY